MKSARRLVCRSSPEEMHFQYPHLSLAQIHAALAYYYDHQDEMDAEIARRWEQANELAARISDPALRKKLIEAKVSVKLYFDVHVRRAVADGFRLRGVDVLTAQDDGAERVSDSELLDRATALGRLVFTQDDEFLSRLTGVRQSW